MQCHRALQSVEIALTKKLINRGATRFLCLNCLGKKFGVRRNSGRWGVLCSGDGEIFCMERFAWMGKIKPGMQAEYKRRHDAIWPEMKAR